MKKSLHGRRHLRARRSAKIGRINKKIRKQAIFWNVVLPKAITRVCVIINRELPRMAAAAIATAEKMKILGDPAHGLSKVKPVTE